MITYDRSPFGLNLLFRFSGSAIYRGTIPGLFTVVFYLIIRAYVTDETRDTLDRAIRHPYAIGILMGSVSFLLVFRVQIAYARYWEAASGVHHFMSKWVDAAMHTAAFHMQCAHYDHIKPPSYFDHPELNAACLSRSRENQSPADEDQSQRMEHRSLDKSIERVESGKRTKLTRRQRSALFSQRPNAKVSMEVEPLIIEPEPRLDGNWGNLFPDNKATFFHSKHPDRKDEQGFAGCQGGRTAPLFLQELAHLTSLMSGVALATLRNDIEGAQSPLDIYEPGSPWPESDPGDLSDPNETTWSRRIATLSNNTLYFLGMGRSPSERTRYNAARPIPVIGGISPAEIQFLQMARGPQAKTQLAWFWLSEFITREHLAGSLGTVGAPIISRIFQFLGDGMIFYNHCRKIMYIPFPFPHAQLSAYYVVLALPAIALLMDQYAEDLWLGIVLSFLTATCLAGINEVARELENPFRNIPNELPLVTLQAQFNEALLTMYVGYHPDLYWEEETKPFSSASPYAKNQSSSNGSSKRQSGSKKSSGSLSDQVEQLLETIQEQAKELEKLRTQVSTEKEDRKTR